MGFAEGLRRHLEEEQQGGKEVKSKELEPTKPEESLTEVQGMVEAELKVLKILIDILESGKLQGEDITEEQREQLGRMRKKILAKYNNIIDREGDNSNPIETLEEGDAYIIPSDTTYCEKPPVRPRRQRPQASSAAK